MKLLIGLVKAPFLLLSRVLGLALGLAVFCTAGSQCCGLRAFLDYRVWAQVWHKIPAHLVVGHYYPICYRWLLEQRVESLT